MKTLVLWWKKESATIISILLALAGAGMVPGVGGKLISVVLPILGGQAVRATVYSPVTVAGLTGSSSPPAS